MNSPEVYGIGAIAVSVIGILFWVIKFLFVKGTKIIEENTGATREIAVYLKNKNGQMEKCLERMVDRLDHIDKRNK